MCCNVERCKIIENGVVMITILKNRRDVDYYTSKDSSINILVCYSPKQQESEELLAKINDDFSKKYSIECNFYAYDCTNDVDFMLHYDISNTPIILLFDDGEYKGMFEWPQSWKDFKYKVKLLVHSKF